MSPVVSSTPVQPAAATTAATTAAEAAVPTVAAMIGPVAPVEIAVTAVSPEVPATTLAMPRLRDGKILPGPDEWRALERRASSFRLRGSAGCIGRPGER